MKLILTAPAKVGIILAFIVYYTTKSVHKTALVIVCHLLLHSIFKKSSVVIDTDN